MFKKRMFLYFLVIAIAGILCNCGGGDSGDGGSGGGKKRIFVTSARYDPNLISEAEKVTGDILTGPEAADALCQLAASGGGLKGEWKAWISDATVDAIDRIKDVGPWYLLTGEKVFNNKDNLMTTPQVPIKITENGEHYSADRCVYTNTEVGGKKLYICTWDGSCNQPHVYGDPESTSNEWTSVEHSGVFSNCYLYCLEQ